MQLVQVNIRKGCWWWVVISWYGQNLGYVEGKARKRQNIRAQHHRPKDTHVLGK